MLILVGVVVSISVLLIITMIGRHSRNIPVVVEPELDLSPVMVQVFEQFYYMVLVRHLDGEEYIEVRDKRSHKVLGTVADDLVFSPIVHNQRG